MKTNNVFAFSGFDNNFDDGADNDKNMFRKDIRSRENESIFSSKFNKAPTERSRVIKFLTYESSHGFNQTNDIKNHFGFQGIHILDEMLIKHSRRVSEFSVKLGQELGLDKELLIELKIAGMLHDIGKVYIPDEIITHPSKLDEDKWKIVRTHTTLGYQILQGYQKYKNIAKYARSHHERIDGLGYPDGLKGNEIPIGARIIAVVDAYEAMTEARPYRQPLSKHQAVDELKRNSGTQFDESIVNVFIEKVLGVKA